MKGRICRLCGKPCFGFRCAECFSKERRRSPSTRRHCREYQRKIRGDVNGY